MTANVSGSLYFLTNASMPGLVKIGYTTGKVTDRIRQLSKTGTPVEFQVAAQFTVATPRKCEKEIHEVLQSARPNPKREFFQGSVSELLKAALPVISKYIKNSVNAELIKSEEIGPDQDDIYFMIYLLHDGYETNQPISTLDLVQHHSSYAPLELEHKLLKLEETGLIKRAGKKYDSGLGMWTLTTDGVKFMFDGKHFLQDLIEEDRKVTHFL